MPVSSLSRYARLTAYNAPAADGKVYSTLPLRPQPETAIAGSTQHIIKAPETLEFLSWRYFGTSELWWRIADMNPLIFPLDLETGTSVTIPRTSDFGIFLRERSFG